MGEATDATGASVERTFYRIVPASNGTEEDFLPAKALGKPLRHQHLARQWAEGVSVFSTFDRAAALSRRFRYRLGRFVATVVVPPSSAVEIEQSETDPFHYTLFGSPELLRSLVNGPTVRIDEG